MFIQRIHPLCSCTISRIGSLWAQCKVPVPSVSPNANMNTMPLLKAFFHVVPREVYYASLDRNYFHLRRQPYFCSVQSLQTQTHILHSRALLGFTPLTASRSTCVCDGDIVQVNSFRHELTFRHGRAGGNYHQQRTSHPTPVHIFE